MELIDVLAQIASQVSSSGQPCELYIGTVDSVDPLSIKLDEQQASIREELLYRTDSVIERKIPNPYHRHSIAAHSTQTAENHSHNISARNTEYALSGYKAVIDGEVQELVDNYIVLNRGLAVGDKVLLLSVQHGQKFIILSHLY